MRVNPYLADVLASMQPALSSPIAGPYGQPEVPPPPPPALVELPPAGPPTPNMTLEPSPPAPPAPPAPPPAAVPAPPAPLPYQPNPGAPNYNPNPGAAVSVVPPAPPRGALLGALGPSSPAAPPPPAAEAKPDAAPAPAEAGPPAPSVNAASPTQEDYGAFPLTAIGGNGVIPAHEVELRGPSLLAAQGAANAAMQGAIGNVHDRNQDVAARDYEVALQQERDARMREAAWQQSIAERDEEMQQRQADFDQSVKALAQTSIDPNHFWATRSTGQKVSAMIGMALGGFLQGARGGSNPGLDAINTAIDRDVRAQEAAFHVARDVTGARQTAFAMAMQKYGNEDAARAMARAAAMDAVQAQMAQSAAMWRGTDAANRADEAIVALSNARMNQVMQGIQFLQPRAVGRTFYDPKTGLTYTEAQAREMAKEFRGYEQDRQKIALNTAGDLMKEDVKANAAAAKAGKEHPIVLPTGETVFAPDAASAEELRKATLAAVKTQRLVNEAKKIREDAATGVPLTPSARGRLNQIQADLVTNFGVQNKLGALSDKDFELAVKGTADLFQYGPGVDARLDRLAETSSAALRDHAKTFPGERPKISGEMPKSAAYPKGAK